MQTSKQHWQAVQRVAALGVPVVFPQYKLAPLSNAGHWCRAAVEFLVDLADDTRYKGREIILMGDSAGGWMVLRLLEAMCGFLLGEEDLGLREEIRPAVERVMRHSGAGIMISPLLDAEISDKLLEVDRRVSWALCSLLVWLTYRTLG